MRVARVLAGLIGLGVLAAGCAEYRPAPLSAVANAVDLESRSLDDPRLHTFVRASLAGSDEPDRRSRWNLTGLTLAAVYYHPDLDIARARLTLSRAAVMTAGQQPNPVLNLGAAVGTAAVAGAIPAGALPLTIGPVVNLLIESAGKRGYRTAEASHLAESARWDLATAAWQVRGRVRGALMDLWAARQRIALTRQRLDLQEELIGLLGRRLQVGETSALDLTRERLNRARVAVSLREFERAADEAEARLAAAIGIPVRAVTGAAVSLDAFERPRPLAGAMTGGELRRQALTTRTDVQAALAQYEAAQAALQLQVARQYPDVTLGPGYTYDLGVHTFSISPSFDLPIFNRNEGPIAEAEAKRQQAAASLTGLQARIIGAIDAAMAAYQAGSRERQTVDGLLADAERREAQVAASFRAGEADRPALVTARLERAAIRLSRFDAVVREREAIGAMEDALHFPLYEPSTVFSAPEADPRVSPGAPS